MNLNKRAHRAMRQAAMMILAMAATGITLRAQAYPFREYTSDDGLPQTQLTYMMQDSRGYIWLPTRNGLARFDGYNFISYLRKDGLPSNLTGKVIETNNGTIWAVTMNGIARFNGVNFTGFPIPDSLGVKNVSKTLVCRDTASFILNASVDFDNQILLGFENGTYSNYTADNPPLQGKNLTVIGISPDKSQLYLTDTEWRGYVYSNGVLTLAHKGPVTDVEIVDGEPVFTDWSHRSPPTIQPFYWNKGNLAVYFTDREGTIWAGTETNIFRLLSQAFVEYNGQSGLPDGTWAVVADPGGGIWTGSVSGDLRYHDGKKFIDRNDYRAVYGGPAAFYRGSTALSNGEIWFSTQNGVLIWDGKKFRLGDFTPEQLQVCIIYEDPVDKSILVGTDLGLFHIKSDGVKHYPQMSWPGYGIVEGVARDHEGNYWLAGHYGMVFFDGKNFVPFRSAPAPVEMVWSVVCDNNGNIWSAGSDGLYICNPDEPLFNEALPDNINLPANVVRDIGNNRLLVGRMMDICIIDLSKYYAGMPDYYQILDRNQGFTGNDCQDNGIVKNKDGSLWILASEKLIRFDPGKLTKNIHPPLNHITRVEIPGDTTEWITALDTSLFYSSSHSLRIRGRHSSIRITYTGISTKNPENLTFQYRMRGLDDNWSRRVRNRSITYSDLPTGNYTFEVHAINSDGIMSDGPDTLNLTVVPTFFQSTFAIITGVLLALALIVFLSWQIRKKVLMLRVDSARRQAETYRLQLNSVIRQFDPHFTFNAVTSVGSLIMKGEKEKAYNYFIKLSNLLRSIITDSSILLRPLQQELEFVTRYCELQQLRFGTRFEYTIEVSPDVSLSTPVPKMIIQSFAENAIKHGLENKKGIGHMEISIRNLDEGVEVTVRDNGIGRVAAAGMHTQGAGTGLKNIAGIVEAINRANREKITFSLTDLYDGKNASGTEVRVFLPYNYTLNFPTDLS
ncbi:MAG: histidine kinase [Bacteroidales bacterium]|nr:histidine kinase [Bacteroidales bacterium]